MIDAPSVFGITHFDFPFTPEKLWKAAQETQTQSRAADEFEPSVSLVEAG